MAAWYEVVSLASIPILAGFVYFLIFFWPRQPHFSVFISRANKKERGDEREGLKGHS
jgi:hypothetical protein